MKNTGIVTKEKDGYRVRFERHLPFSVETVWGAITNPEKLKIWFTDFEMDFVQGGKLVVRFRDKDQTESFGRIIRIDAPHVFEYSWEDELAIWELFDEGRNQCRLVLTYSKLPDSYAISVPAGWHLLLDELERMLNGNREPYPFGAGETPESKKMKAAYADLLQNQFPELNT